MITSKRGILFCFGVMFIGLISLFSIWLAPDIKSNISIDLNFKMNFSDNPEFKEVNFDDSLWENGTFKRKSTVKEKNNVNKPMWIRKTIVIPSSLKEKNIMLLVEGITNGFEIYLNGSLIGNSPIYPNQNFNVWNTTYNCLIARNIINFDSENVLAIRTYSGYEYGTSRNLTIGPYDSIQDKAQYTNLWTVNLYFGFIVLMLSFCLYFAMGYYYNDKMIKQLMFAIVNFFSVIYYSNYIVYKLPISYLMYEKIVFISLHLMLISMILFVVVFLDLRITRNVKLICTIMVAISIVGNSRCKDLIELYNFRNYYMISFGVAFSYALFVICKQIINKNKNIFKIAPALLLAIITGGVDTFGEITKNSHLNNVQLSGFSIIILILIMGFEMLKEYSSLYIRASKDGLTGVYNHGYIKNELNNLNDKIKIFKKGVSLVFYDIDDFKKINDIYGHSFGDNVLKSVAKIISNNGISGSVVARYGGEEFVLLLFDVDKERAIEVSNKIRKKISEISFYYKDEEVRITISGGVTSKKEVGNTYSGKDFIDEADNAMYYSKKNGKNKITHYSDMKN